MHPTSFIRPTNDTTYLKSSRSVFPRNRWFDEECKRQKRSVNTSAKDYRRDPDFVERAMKV